MAKTLRFEGHSDDTFGEYGCFGEDYDCCASGAMIIWQVMADGVGVNVCGQYAGKQWPAHAPGCWIIGVQPTDEDAVFPSWPIRMSMGDSGYSVALEIDAPDDTTIECLNLRERAGK